MNTVWIIHALLSALKAEDDKHSWSSLKSADKKEVNELLGCLLKNGNDDQWSPLHLAAALNNPEIVKTLLPSKTQNGSDNEQADTKADPNAQSKSGCTPLHVAAATTCCPEIVELLLDRGADPWLRNKKGQLPFDLAEKNKKLRETPVYWRLHQATYLPWNPPTAAQTAPAAPAAPQPKAEEERGK